MKRALVLGARAPASLEWVRAFAAAGWQAAVADSLVLPLARASRHAVAYHRLPEPRSDVNAYGAALARLVEERGYDLVLPTCEEAFFLAHQRHRLPADCRVVVDAFDKIAGLHHKGRFAGLVEGWEVAAPETHLVTDRAALMAVVDDPARWVLKPAYSRFATHSFVRPTAAQLARIVPTPQRPWVAQRFAAGDERCSYSILVQGRLVAHGCYRPRYRVGKGSGMYFEQVRDPQVRRFVERFGATTGFDGQVGFDFIAGADGAVQVLECNPRATSGVHLFGDRGPELVAALDGRGRDCLEPTVGRDSMIAMAMLLFGTGRYGFEGAGFWSDLWRTTDAIHRRDDPGPQWLQLVGLTEIAWRAVVRRRGLLAAATEDIEWNGDPLGDQPCRA